jgi:hypothetical protein
MKRTIIISLLFSAVVLMLCIFMDTSTADSLMISDVNWTKVSSNKTFTAYAERASIIRTGTKSQMWILFDRVVVDTIDHVPYISVGVLHEFNCKSRRFRVLQAIAFSGHMEAGKIVESSSIMTDWEAITDRGSSGAMWKIACGKERL